MFLPRTRRPVAALALAAALGAGAMAAMPAYAQKPQTTVSKPMIKPMQEAAVAIAAKDWATATAKLEAAAAVAKTPLDKLTVEQHRYQVAYGSGDKQAIIRAVEAVLALNALSPADTRTYEAGLIQAYDEAGDKPKAMQLSRAFLDKHGGTHAQFSTIAIDAAMSNDNAGAITYGEKAIELAKAAGEKPPEVYYRTLLRAHKQADAMDKYYAVEETLVAEYPKDDYWRELIGRAQTAPGFSKDMTLDVYRALVHAGVKLTAEQKGNMASEALRRALPGEAVAILQPAIAAGELGAAGQANADADKKALADATERSKLEKAGLAKEEADIVGKGVGSDMAALGEVYYTYGEYAKAADILQKALAKGIADPAKADAARLHLGMAQIKAGQKDAAIATFAEVKTNGAAAVLARNWTLVAQKS